MEICKFNEIKLLRDIESKVCSSAQFEGGSPSLRPSFEVIPPERGRPALGGAKRRDATRRIALGNTLVSCMSAPPSAGAIGSH